jgi:hypothetical protein
MKRRNQASGVVSSSVGVHEFLPPGRQKSDMVRFVVCDYQGGHDTTFYGKGSPAADRGSDISASGTDRAVGNGVGATEERFVDVVEAAIE